MQSWKWIARYVMVLVAAVVLGAGIAELTVFKQTAVGSRLTAAVLARFLGYATALAVFWLAGRRAGLQLQQSTRSHALGLVLLPLVTLIVVCIAYEVAAAILRPFFNLTAKEVYNWVFVLGITACAVWLIAVLYHHAEALVDLVQLPKRQAPALQPVATCRYCNTELAASARFCTGCGKAVAEDPLTSGPQSV
jgi:hypothetical protein